ncbi:hypothetical protein DF185_21680 [Marinifilum breve]|uniref:Uncharacterized protein n=1 Tax=Marinifilum breve TaxID=2184082 RepID=A0A2V3ZVI4_9BACT|nr:hypothetical protein DF185_21680 [Marinifilum breve]
MKVISVLFFLYKVNKHWQVIAITTYVVVK